MEKLPLRQEAEQGHNALNLSWLCDTKINTIFFANRMGMWSCVVGNVYVHVQHYVGKKRGRESSACNLVCYKNVKTRRLIMFCYIQCIYM